MSFGWLFLILFLGALVYAAWVIKKEKKTFLDNPIPFQLGSFYLQIPKWWTLIEDRKNQLIFERRDTKYDWAATFSLITEAAKVDSLDKLLIDFVQKKKILFDPESSDINFKTNMANLELIEVGGTATEDGIDRIYYDIAIIRSKQEIIICESRSSVLNGAVEGPYFEEVIKRISN
jgi:hypothetical protein